MRSTRVVEYGYSGDSWKKSFGDYRKGTTSEMTKVTGSIRCKQIKRVFSKQRLWMFMICDLSVSLESLDASRCESTVILSSSISFQFSRWEVYHDVINVKKVHLLFFSRWSTKYKLTSYCSQYIKISTFCRLWFFMLSSCI